ncbi:MAG: hypothetical protein GF418_14235 [Chitinivibrionales bacterium]|nr:hypothetical protein [Chitinivibrionales bacterium]MBD3396778.1 hypothetical protein [Chitinivibrionales bacterium]
MLVSVFNEYSRLQHTFLGIVSEVHLARAGEIFPAETTPWWMVVLDRLFCRAFAGARIPRAFLGGFSREIASLEHTLLEHGVKLSRPQRVTPLPGEPAGLSQMFARDPVIVVGDTVIAGRQRLPALRKEIRGFQQALDRLGADGRRVIRVPDRGDIYLEGGDVLVDLPYVYVGTGPLASNMNGASWLHEQLGADVHVVPVPIVKPGIFHLDTCLTLVGPRLGIICRDSLAEPLPAPLRDHAFIEIDERTRRQIGLNVLVLDRRTVVLQRRHKALRQALERKGFTTVPLDFNWHALAGGAFRCATHPLVRAG